MAMKVRNTHTWRLGFLLRRKRLAYVFFAPTKELYMHQLLVRQHRDFESDRHIIFLKMMQSSHQLLDTLLVLQMN